MPNIYEALMRASEEREALKRKRSVPSAEEAGPAQLSINMADEMLVLLEAIESLLPRARKRIIQFIGSQEGDNASTMAREYARFSASATGLSVLLLEPRKADSCSGLWERSMPEKAVQATARPNESRDALFHQVEGFNLFVSPPANGAVFDSAAAGSPSNHLLWTLLKDRFDLIVIDSSPVALFSGSPAIAPSVDGVVLVFESDMTMPVAGGSSNGLGLTSMLDVVARGALMPQQVVTCLGAPVLILTPVADRPRVPSPARPG